MASRRSFIIGMLATGLAPKPTWADAGSPAFLSAGLKPDGTYVLCGLTEEGQITFELPLPARGHAAAAHPNAPEAVAFARRPGTFAIVLDCTNGREKARLHAPEGRHFYGHGAFSADGELLFTTENDFEAAIGKVGIWNARDDYRRIGEFLSGGVGPHDIKLLPDSKMLVVANGGIETHPQTGRTKLNLPTMQSNLSYLTLDGKIILRMQLGPDHQRNSMRHLAVSQDGTVAFATQWQGDLTENLPLLGIHNPKSDSTTLLEPANIREMQGYLGSVAVNSRARQIVATSPRSGVLQVFIANGAVTEVNLPDVCGAAANSSGLMVTTGTGLVRTSAAGDIVHKIAWDNHLIDV